MRSVNHNLNIQPGWTPIHSQLLILDKGNYNSNAYPFSEEKVKNKNKVGAVVSVGAGGVTCGSSAVAVYKFRCNGCKCSKSSKNYYEGQLHQKNVELTEIVFTWTVPYNGRYNILCVDSSGNITPTDMADLCLRCGKGAKVCDILILNKGDQIKILAGQQCIDCYTNLLH